MCVFSVNSINNSRINSYDFHGKTKVNIPYGVKVISNYAFSYVSTVTVIKIPNSVIKIRGYAFSNCTALKYINIPNSVIKIGKYAFLNCSWCSHTRWYFLNAFFQKVDAPFNLF